MRKENREKRNPLIDIPGVVIKMRRWHSEVPMMRNRMNEPIKLWHDDVRPAPEGWTWARTNEKAMEILKAGNVIAASLEYVIAASLDHDLGYEGPPPGECQECHGLGKVWEEKLDSSEPIAFPCAACDGDGFIGGDILYIAGTA